MQELNGRLQQNVRLADYTSWRVGGPARQLFKPLDVQDLAVFLKSLSSDEPLLWLGLGSNLLVRDAGYTGTVIVTQGALKKIEQTDNLTIRAEAGVSCGTLARHTARLGLSGIEFLAGVPGTIGGALAMNAGCFGSETWQWVEKVETIDRNGVIRIRQPDEFEVSYRHVIKPVDEWFVAGHFRLQLGEKAESLQKIKQLLDHRATTQPTNEPSCGSVFRNPQGNFAARLIEQCGLKGFRCGGAFVSEKHANFIINDGNATAADIENLIMEIAAIVADKCKIELQKEVHIVGQIRSS